MSTEPVVDLGLRELETTRETDGSAAWQVIKGKAPTIGTAAFRPRAVYLVEGGNAGFAEDELHRALVDRTFRIGSTDDIVGIYERCPLPRRPAIPDCCCYVFVSLTRNRTVYVGMTGRGEVRIDEHIGPSGNSPLRKLFSGNLLNEIRSGKWVLVVIPCANARRAELERGLIRLLDPEVNVRGAAG